MFIYCMACAVCLAYSIYVDALHILKYLICMWIYTPLSTLCRLWHSAAQFVYIFYLIAATYIFGYSAIAIHIQAWQHRFCPPFSLRAARTYRDRQLKQYGNGFSIFHSFNIFSVDMVCARGQLAKWTATAHKQTNIFNHIACPYTSYSHRCMQCIKCFFLVQQIYYF